MKVLTKELTLKQIVFGEIKFARLQAKRDKRTYFGLSSNGRNVEGDCHEVAVPSCNAEIEGRDLTSYRTDLIRRRIRKICGSPKEARIIEMRLFGGMDYDELSRRTELKPGTLRSRVSRVREPLGLLPERTKKDVDKQE